jgi:riboflavin-specific deaminase-like protein
VHPLGFPQVVVNAASSIDGKITTSARGKTRFTSDADRRAMDAVRAGCDALLIGAGTLRAEDPPLQVKDPALRRRRLEDGRPETLVNVLLSATLRVPVEGRFFTAPGIRRIVATVEEAPDDVVRRLGESSEVLKLGRGRVGIPALLGALASRGIGRLLVEGGGEVNAAFLEADCVDEIFLTIAPVVIGGRDSPTACEGEGFAPEEFRRFELVDSRTEAGDVFLHYKRSSPRFPGGAEKR